MSETTQNVAKIITFMMRMDDADFDHTLATLQQIKSNRAKQSKKSLALTSTQEHPLSHVEK
tara:strand:+ start:212 stop:394 length:183 start_codon:yes stop_codon:yes gene_type:complete